MALTRIKVWEADETLTSDDLNAEFNNILENGASNLISPLTDDLDADNHIISDGVYHHTAFTLGDGDPTPSVANGTLFVTGNTAPTTITALDGGTDGHTIYIIFQDSNTTIDFTGTNLKGNAGVNWSPVTNDSMQCIYYNGNWFCRISDNTA